MKKIVIMCSSFAVGGAENMVAQLIYYLNKEKFSVSAIVSNPRTENHIQKLVDEGNIDVFCANNSTNKNILSRILTFFRINKRLSKIKPNIIHTNLDIAIYVMPYVLFHDVEYIHTVHNIPEKDAGTLLRFAIKTLVKANKIKFSSISQEIQDRIVCVYGVSKDLAPVIVNPVDCKKFQCVRNQSSDTIRFISVGRLVPQKNQKLLIDAFKIVRDKIQNVTLSIAGDGYLKNDLLNQIKENNLQDSVFLLGNCSNMNELYANSDVFVLSSDYEGLPLTVLEAEASGLPIISTDVGGVKDIVSSKCGILVHPNNANELANAMCNMACNYQERIEMGYEAAKSVQQYDIPCFIKKYTDLYTGD